MTNGEYFEFLKREAQSHRQGWDVAWLEEWRPTPAGPHRKDVERFLQSVMRDPRMRP